VLFISIISFSFVFLCLRPVFVFQCNDSFICMLKNCYYCWECSLLLCNFVQGSALADLYSSEGSMLEVVYLLII